MRRFRFATFALVLFGLFASACLLIGGCNSDPHDTHVATNVGSAR